MFLSKDKLLHIDVTETLADVVFPSSAWSVINIPVDEVEAKTVLNNLFNSPCYRHTSLILNRHRRRDRLKSLANIGNASGKWSYLDTVSIWYEKPSSCSNNGLLPIAEMGVLLYKGAVPDTKKTSWFSSEYANATNMWGLTTQGGEGDSAYYQRFSWELNLLMLSMCSPLETRKFIYAADFTQQELESLFQFINEYDMAVQLYVKTDGELDVVARQYELFLNKKRG